MAAQATSSSRSESTGKPQAGLAGLGLAAIGIVFGDIGTSPLYTLKTVLSLAGGILDRATLLGLLSLIFWTLMIVTSIKYVTIAMSLNNDGEGGIVALMSLLGIRRKRSWIVLVGLLGAALIYGDGAITPAISVLTALEGLQMALPHVQHYVLPVTITVLIGLFIAQPFGTATIGRAFGPVMVLWFGVIALLGIGGIWHHPAVLAAFNPLYAAHYLLHGGGKAFLVLGAVFLCVTGAEALYADMGHFGARPIRLSWSMLVLPSLVLNYAGQVAIVIDGAPVDGNIFYRLCPGSLLLPMIVLATLATIIASQAIITGAFSMTRQIILLGWLPRLAIRQTSAEGFGQIYIGAVNWLLMAATIGLVLIFRRSDNLASAYGIAVSLTMLMTTLLLFIALREIYGWSMITAGAVAAGLFVVDISFVSANMVKIAAGGYVPLLFAATIYGAMWIWHRGNTALRQALLNDTKTMAALTDGVARVPGTAVFLTRSDRDIPPVMIWHVTHSRSLHKDLIVLTIDIVPVPRVADDQRLQIDQIAPGFWRVRAKFGFMQKPDIAHVLDALRQHGCVDDVGTVTFYVGHVTIKNGGPARHIPHWQEAIYAFMERNSQHVADTLALPQARTVELGRVVSL